MTLDFIMGMVRPYLPTITQKFLPKVDAAIEERLAQEDEELHGDEQEAVIMISRKDGHAYLRIVRLNAEAKVVSSTAPQQVSEFLENILNQAIQ